MTPYFMRTVAVIILISSCLCQLSYSQEYAEPAKQLPKETIKFRGVQLGSNESVLKEKFPEFSCFTPKSKDSLFNRTCVTHKDQANVDCHVKNSDDDFRVLDYKSLASCLQVAAATDKNDATKAWIYAGKQARIIANFVNDALIQVNIEFDVNDCQEVLDVLKVKYGNPDTFKSEVVSNKMGANFKNDIYSWNAGGITLTINKYGRDLTKSTVIYILDTFVQEVEAKTKRKNAEAAKSL